MKTVILYFLVAVNLLLTLGLGYIVSEDSLFFSKKLMKLEEKVHAWSPIEYGDDGIVELDINSHEALKKIGGNK